MARLLRECYEHVGRLRVTVTDVQVIVGEHDDIAARKCPAGGIFGQRDQRVRHNLGRFVVNILK